jgi:hypothetical protein
MLDVNRAFEAAVRRDPANWFWVHNRWKARKRWIEDGSQEPGARSQEIGVGGQETEGGRQKTEDRGQRTEDGRQGTGGGGSQTAGGSTEGANMGNAG